MGRKQIFHSVLVLLFQTHAQLCLQSGVLLMLYSIICISHTGSSFMTCHFWTPGPLCHTPPWEPGQAFLTQDTWPPWRGTTHSKTQGHWPSATFDLCNRLLMGLWQKRSTTWLTWLHGVVRGVSLAMGKSPRDPSAQPGPLTPEQHLPLELVLVPHSCHSRGNSPPEQQMHRN